MVLKRYPRYHGQFKGNVTEIHLSLLSDQIVNLRKYEEGELDTVWVGLLPPRERDRARQRHADDYHSAPWPYIEYLILDVNQSPFHDIRVRQALSLAIDREVLAGHYLIANYGPANGGFIPFGVPGYSSTLALPYAPERARELLAEAGYPDGLDFPVIYAQGFKWTAPTCCYLESQWRRVLGIHVKWEILESQALEHALHQSSPILALAKGWESKYPDPHDFLHNGLNYYPLHWKNETFSQLIQSAEQTTEQNKRLNMYQKADRILMDALPIIPLTYGRLKFLVKPWVKQYPISPYKWWYWKDIVIDRRLA